MINFTLVLAAYALGALITSYIVGFFDLEGEQGLTIALWPFSWCLVAATLVIAPFAIVGIWLRDLGRKHGERW